jgi:ABC-2 type transport system ATP-binding protein
MSTASLPPAIEVQGLRKEFGDKIAVADLTLRVERGEVFGFLGPNGAGKTTAVKMLLGLINPTAGKGQLLGAPLGDPHQRARVGFLPEHFRFHDWLTATEFLTLHGNLYRMPHDVLPGGCLNYWSWWPGSSCREEVACLSKGMLQRIGLAQLCSITLSW